MKILLIHNEYARLSGEEVTVRDTQRVLLEHGHQVLPFIRSSAEIYQMPLGRSRAFFSGLYSPSSRSAISRLLDDHQPDLVHVHNLFPLISPSVLTPCRRAGVPIVMTVHNYRLMCPNGLHMAGGEICERCLGGKEYWCVLNRCEGTLLKSIGYALRNAVARKLGYFRRNVTVYAALTEFQRSRLIASGFPSDRILILPNMVPDHHLPPTDALGDYVGFVGRISPEKGIHTLLAAAKRCPDIPFNAAGACERMPHLLHHPPPNFQFVGHLDHHNLAQFYRNSRILLMCSVWYEGFPTSLIQAMLHARPVICSRIGGLHEIVEDGRTGLLFTPGDSDELADKVAFLYHRPDLCRQMGLAAREKVRREYSPEKVYSRLIEIYTTALRLGPGAPDHSLSTPQLQTPTPLLRR